MAALCVRTRNVIRGSRGGERESEMCLTEHAPQHVRPPSVLPWRTPKERRRGSSGWADRLFEGEEAVLHVMG
jgi:hypothetical protein